MPRSVFSGGIRPASNQVLRKIGQRSIVTDTPRVTTPAGVSAPAITYPLEITTARPKYVTAPTGYDPATVTPVYVRFGTINGVPASNFSDSFLASLGASGDTITYVYAECTLSQQDTLAVTSWQIIADTTAPDYSSEWTSSLTRPTTVRPILGYVIHNPTTGISIDTGRGDIRIEEYLASVSSSTGAYTRNLTHRRV